MLEKPKQPKAGTLTSETRERILEKARRAKARAIELVITALQEVARSERRLRQSAETLAAAQATRDDLQRELGELAVCLRTLGVLPEQAVIAAKEMTDDAMDDTKGTHVSRAAVRALRDDVVRWTIDAYYTASQQPPTPPRLRGFTESLGNPRPPTF